MASSPEERIELARRGIEMYDAGDVEGALALLDADVEVLAPSDQGLDAGTYVGIEGFLKWANNWNEAWERFERRIQRIEAIGERHAIAVVDQKMVGWASGVELEMTSAYAFEVGEEGRCVWFALYNDVDAGFAEVRRREGVEGS